MARTLLMLSLFLCAVSQTRGTIINVTNLSAFNPAIDLPVFDIAGNTVPAAGIEVSVGNYGGGLPPAPFSNPRQGFQQFATTQTATVGSGLGSPDSFFRLEFQQATALSASFIGEAIYVLIELYGGGQGNTILWRGPAVVDDVVGIEGQTNVAISTASGTLINGQVIDPPPISYGPMFPPNLDFDAGLTPVFPEPSTALLCGFAGLSLLRRRRRD